MDYVMLHIAGLVANLWSPPILGDWFERWSKTPTYKNRSALDYCLRAEKELGTM